MTTSPFLSQPTTRRLLLGKLGLSSLSLLALPAMNKLAFAQSTQTPTQASAQTVDLGLAGGPNERVITTAFPQKGPMILQRTRPPLLETPFEVFDQGVFTPNDRFYVRWHWAVIPTDIDADSFRLNVHGAVKQPLSLSLSDLQSLPHFEIAAVNQCSGNSRGLFQPRVPGAQWTHGAMGNARWTGLRLKDLLNKAGIDTGAAQVRFRGLDEPVVGDAPHFMKSLDLDHAMDGEVMIAYAMNGEQLPLLNGFPLRLIVPGWYATYWVKMLSDIEVLAAPDDNFWTKSAYRIPDTPFANIKPGETNVKTVPINRMLPRSFITNLRSGQAVTTGTATPLRGIAFGGDCGVAKVEISADGGRTWQAASLGQDEGKYSFRQWQANITLTNKGTNRLQVRCTNANGAVQPTAANWNPSGFMRNVIEEITITAA
ncbi:MAG TPA: molybdopterin-dependent oxidoreductase [Dongiaceae bacterium]|nr:molybdopterin-dependent oxidoreductase [Dongiaceae bacterium]